MANKNVNEKNNTNETFRPAGVNDNVSIYFTEFAADRNREEIRVGDGSKFVEADLLRSFGFKSNNEGIMSLETSNNGIQIEGNTIRRVVNGKVLSEVKAQSKKIKRLLARARNEKISDTLSKPKSEEVNTPTMQESKRRRKTKKDSR